MVRSGVRSGRLIRGPLRPQFKKTFVPRHPFDITLSEALFPKVVPAIDDSALTAVSSNYNKKPKLVLIIITLRCAFC